MVTRMDEATRRARAFHERNRREYGNDFLHVELVATLIRQTEARVRRETLKIVEAVGKEMARENAGSTAPAGFLCSATAGRVLIALKAQWRGAHDR